MVPFLYLLYARIGLPPAVATPMAHATSLAVIVPAAVRGLLGYRGTGLVQWRSALPLAAVAAVTAALTAPFATRLPAAGLRLGFGVFLLTIAADLLRPRRATADDLPMPTRVHAAGSAMLGMPVGALSAMLGVGGGVPATMGMHYILRLPFRVIPATSLAVILFTAAAGSASYMLVSAGTLPFGWVIGHVDLGHGLPLAVGAVATAPLGVYVNRRAPVALMRRIFGVLLLVIGIKLLVDHL